MQIIATFRERRRDDGSLSIEAVLMLGEEEHILERNCASRRIAQGLAEEELRLIRRLVLARLRQVRTEKRLASTPLSGEPCDLRKQPLVQSGEQREQPKPLVMPSLTGGPAIPPPGLERYRGQVPSSTLPSPVPSGTKPNGKLPHSRPPVNTISTADL